MKITIVTVTRQAAQILEKTIVSVLGQTRKPDEYIIVDGASDDGTPDVIRRYEKYLTAWVSEPDTGIYNAMNKALALAKGDWILFMNAADVFASDDVLEKMAPVLEGVSTNTMLVYGDCLQVFPDGRTRYDKALPVRLADRRMICSHQSLFSRKTILNHYPFEEEYRICADHHFVLTVLTSGHNATYVPFPVGKVQLEHYSWKQQKQVHRERWAMVRCVKRSLEMEVYFFIIFVRLFLGSVVKRILIRHGS